LGYALMGDNVWMRLFAGVAGFVSSLLKNLRKTQTANAGGLSAAVPASAVDSILTSNYTIILEIVRTKETDNAIFGKAIIGNKQICVTMERKSVAIPLGVYSTHLEFSPHFGFATPHIDVPNRTYIEIHPANYPTQLEGCIAVGSSIDNDALDNSKAAFDTLMTVLPQAFTVSISAQYENSAS